MLAAPIPSAPADFSFLRTARRTRIGAPVKSQRSCRPRQARDRRQAVGWWTIRTRLGVRPRPDGRGYGPAKGSAKMWIEFSVFAG